MLLHYNLDTIFSAPKESTNNWKTAEEECRKKETKATQTLELTLLVRYLNVSQHFGKGQKQKPNHLGGEKR